VWRRFLVRSDASIEHLRQVICCLFDFDRSYPYLLRTATDRYSVNFDPEPEEGEEEAPTRRPGWKTETVDENAVPIESLVESV
jgi:hypothetical protein